MPHLLKSAAGAVFAIFALTPPTPAEPELVVGWPLAGIKLPLAPTQHGEQPGHPGRIPELMELEGRGPILSPFRPGLLTRPRGCFSSPFGPGLLTRPLLGRETKPIAARAGENPHRG